MTRVSGLAMDNQGNMFLSDEFNHRVVKVSAAGRVVWTIGAKGRGDGSFSYPRGVAVMENLGRVFVCDSWNHRIVALDLDGNFEFSFGEVGGHVGQFYEPQAICATPADDLIVVDRGNHRLQRFSADGKFKGMVGRRGSTVEQEMALLYNTPPDLFSPPCLLFPSGIALVSPETVAVLDAGNRRVLMFTDQLQYRSEYRLFDNERDSKFTPSAIAANDAGFFFLLDADMQTVLQIAPPALVVSRFVLEAPKGEQEELQPLIIATAGGLLVARGTPTELLFYEPKRVSLRDAVMQVRDSEGAREDATESLVALGIDNHDAQMIHEAVSTAISGEEVSFKSLRAAAKGLSKIEQPINLYLLLSRAVHEAQRELELIEAKEVQLLRDLEPKIALSATETAACEAALIADDASSPHSVNEADALREYQEMLLQLKLVMAQKKREALELVDLMRDAAIFYRRRNLWEAFDFGLGVLLQVAFKEGQALRESLQSIRDRLGEMVSVSKAVLADSPELKALNRFIYIGRYRPVLHANRGLHLGVFASVAGAIASVLGEQQASSPALAKCMLRTDKTEQEVAVRLLNTAVDVFLAGGADQEVMSASGRLIWALLRSYPPLRKLAAFGRHADASELLGYNLEDASIAPAELERFVYLHVFERALAEGDSVAHSVLEEAASVAWKDRKLADVLKVFRGGSEDAGSPSGRNEFLLESIRQVKSSIVNHGQSWARVILESYMRLAGLRDSPRATANKALMDLLSNRQDDCYQVVFEAHRLSLVSSAQLLEFLTCGVIASGDDNLASMVGRELSTTQLVESITKLGTSICPPLADRSGKPMHDSDSLLNLGERNQVLHVVLATLNGVRLSFATSSFWATLSRVDLGVQPGDDGDWAYFVKGTADFLSALADNYVRSQDGLREWLWSHWGKESLGSRDSVFNAQVLADVAASSVLLADRDMRKEHLLEAMRRVLDRLQPVSLPSKRTAGRSRAEHNIRPHKGRIKLPRKLLRGTFYLYCDPSTRSEAEEFWKRIYGSWDMAPEEAMKAGLNFAAGTIRPRASFTAVRTLDEKTAGKMRFLDAVTAWMQDLCEYYVDLVKVRAGRLDESGAAFKPTPFVDGAKDMVADLCFTSCREAVLTVVPLATSSGSDLSRISGWDADGVKARLAGLIEELGPVHVPDNLCDWAQSRIERIAGIYRTFFGQLKAVHEVILASSSDEELSLDEGLAPTPVPDVGDQPLKFIPDLLVANYHFGANVAGVRRIVMRLRGDVSDGGPSFAEWLLWLDTSIAAVEGTFEEVQRRRQTHWSRRREARARESQAQAGQRWPARLGHVSWLDAAELLAEMADAASALCSELRDARSELIVNAWSPEAPSEKKSEFFQLVEGSLRADATHEKVKRKLHAISMAEESQGDDVKQAVRLLATFNVRLRERLSPGLANPYGIISDEDGGLLIADFGNGRIARFDRSAKFLEVLAGPKVPGRSGSFVGPFGLALLNGHVWCSFADGDLLIQYDDRFKEAARVGPTTGEIKFGPLFGLASDGQRLYVADYDGDCICMVTQTDARDSFVVRRVVTVEGPLGVAVDHNGRIAVSLPEQNAVHLFDGNWEQVGVLEGFSSPHFLAFAPDSSLFVADTRHDCVKRFSRDGELLYSIPCRAPGGVWVDRDELFVTGVDTGEFLIYSLSSET